MRCKKDTKIMKRKPVLGKGKKPVFPDGNAREQNGVRVSRSLAHVTSFLWTFLPPQPTSPHQSTVLAVESSEHLWGGLHGRLISHLLTNPWVGDRKRLHELVAPGHPHTGAAQANAAFVFLSTNTSVDL